MEYEVRMSGKFNKIIRQMPSNAREMLYRLIEDIKALLKIPLYGMGSGRAIQDVYREDYVDPVRSVTREYEMPIA